MIRPMSLASIVAVLVVPGFTQAQQVYWVYPQTPAFYYPEQSGWQYSCDDCAGSVMDCDECKPVAETRTTPVYEAAPAAGGGAQFLHLSPARRYTVLNKDGELFAFNAETGQLYRYKTVLPSQQGKAPGYWAEESDAIGITHTPAPAPANGQE